MNSNLDIPIYEQRAARVRLLLMDVDGVLTDGRLFNVPGPDGKMVETKGFDSQDGIALQWLEWHGIHTGVISGRVSAGHRGARAPGQDALRLPGPHRKDPDPGGNPASRAAFRWLRSPMPATISPTSW